MGCGIMIGVGGRCRCTVDGFKFQVGEKVSCFRFQVSGRRFQVSSFRLRGQKKGAGLSILCHAKAEDPAS